MEMIFVSSERLLSLRSVSRLNVMADNENESYLRCDQVSMLTVNKFIPISVRCSIMTGSIHNSFLINSSLYVSSRRASLVLLTVQYSPLLFTI